MLALDQPFCLFTKNGKCSLLQGEVKTFSQLAQIPRPSDAQKTVSVSMIPYSQIRERGFLVRENGEEIISIVGKSFIEFDLSNTPATARDAHVEIEGDLRFNLSDEEYISMVRSVIDCEIKNGEGSNFLISRKILGKIKEFKPTTPITILRRFIANEFGAYCNFCFFDGEKYFLGSSPERHLTYEGTQVLMNPVCGTFSKKNLTSKNNLRAFLEDPKEIHELFQVLDEELKMMSKICSKGGAVEGPYIKEMRALLHTEYELRGISHRDKIDAFRDSMYAATMVGSPLENAARIIHKYEKDPRRYYSSAILFLGTDDDDREYLDSAITIRTMEISRQGDFSIQVGASIVRDSVPEKECEEIKTKSRGLLKAISTDATEKPVLNQFFDDELKTVLLSRNRFLSRFWTHEQTDVPSKSSLKGKSILIIDNEDEFTYMLKHMLKKMGLRTKIVRSGRETIPEKGYDFVLIGPGPGDPTHFEDKRISESHRITKLTLNSQQKLISVCLGHQILSHILGFPLIKLDPPLQGVQVGIDFFGRNEIAGFYNTFVPQLPPGHQLPEGATAACGKNNELYAVKSKHFASFQFHLESVLTSNGYDILEKALMGLLKS